MHPSDVFIDQNPSDLCLTIVDGKLDMSQFHQLVSESVSLGEYTLTATIIGASHVISLSNAAGEPLFYEVLACVQPQVSSVQRTWPVEEIPTPVSLRTGLLSYSFRDYTIRRWNDLVGKYVDDTVEKCKFPRSGEARIFYQFPQDSLPAKPATVVKIQLESPRQVIIESIHSYPTKAVVFSHSTISV